MTSRILAVAFIALACNVFACTIFYYVDRQTGKIYFVNNEDYWYDVKPYIQIIPKSKKKLGRMWYGWNQFGQGGVNEKGLVVDGAVTPEQKIPNGYRDPQNMNITDEILSECATVQQAIDLLEIKKIALKNAHIFLGDREGNAVLVEWVNGNTNIVAINNNRLVATNFNISDTNQKELTCWRYPVIHKELEDLDARAKEGNLALKEVGQVIAKAVQTPRADSTGRVGGTLYTTFIDLTEMKLIIVYKLDNSKKQEFDILSELNSGRTRKIMLE